MPIGRHCTPAAREIMDIFPNQPFHIFVNNFSGRRVRVSKCTIIAKSKTPPDIIHPVKFIDKNFSQLGTPAEYGIPFNATAERHSNVFAVH